MEGDLCRHLYIFESRRVKFYQTSAEGREQILKVFDCPGDILAFNPRLKFEFPELSLIEDHFR